MGSRRLKASWHALGTMQSGTFKVVAHPLPGDVRVTNATLNPEDETFTFILESAEWEGHYLEVDEGWLPAPVIEREEVAA